MEAAILIVASLFSASCAFVKPTSGTSRGHLLIIGGGLDDDERVYERFIKLSSLHGAPRIVLVLTATEPGYAEHSETSGKVETLHAWAPQVTVTVIGHKTSTEETVAALDRATGVLFTGGDQSRIAERYLHSDAETPSHAAFQRLLARGGVIAGASAGDAMMGSCMIVGGDNSRALGAARDVNRDAIDPLKTRAGMGFLPWAITDSHFFERARVARLVVALEKSGKRFGLGVGETAAVEVNCSSGEVTGLTDSDSLLVDAGAMKREGGAIRGLRARLIGRNERVSLAHLASSKLPPLREKPSSPAQTLRVASPSQNRQLALWRFFKSASHLGSGVWEIYFNEGWRITAWPDHDGWVVFEMELASAPRSPELKNIEE